MLTKIMTWVSISALFLAVVGRSSGYYQLVLQCVVCAGALVVVVQAWHADRYSWIVGFLAIALLFNPLAPVGLSPAMYLWLDWTSLAAFLISLAGLKRQPALAMPSGTNQTPRKVPW
jgi:hypothetical protein